MDPMSARPLYVQLADEYGVACLTARRAARELRERGLIVTVRGEGCFDVGQPTDDASEETEADI
ncbi:hypothetical protein [Streptomyces sp. NPDC093970]|uniref:hypothetical protein n=1 Tax=Streptomyces sp. NPDC093970 TaxID=3155076 RepID=UPI0034240C8A